MADYAAIPLVSKKEWKQALTNNFKLQNLVSLLDKEPSLSWNTIHNPSRYKRKELLHMLAGQDDINTLFGKGETVFHWATVTFESEDCVCAIKTLNHLGANINATDFLGRTPLHWAVNNLSGNKVIKCLLDLGASPNIRDKYGSTPYQHALLHYSPPSELLEEISEDKSKPGFIPIVKMYPLQIMPSEVDTWIEKHINDKGKNNQRLNALLSTPGLGLLHHMEEVQEQARQVLVLFHRISDAVAKENPLLAFVPQLAGSTAEGTKCIKPDEIDVLLDLIHFRNICKPEFPDADYINAIHKEYLYLKYVGNNNTRFKNYLTEDGDFDRDAILIELMTHVHKTLMLRSTWDDGSMQNIYPSWETGRMLKETSIEGGICNMKLIWHGQYYKYIQLSVDIVPGILLEGWWPPDALSVNPIGDQVEKKLYVILKGVTLPDGITDDDDDSQAILDKIDHLLGESENSELSAVIGQGNFIEMTNERCNEVKNVPGGPTNLSQHHIGEQQDTDSDSMESDDDGETGDILFRLSFCQAEIQSTRSLPSDVRQAYMLGKVLLNYVPSIQSPINNGGQLEEIQHTELFSYIMKTALFHAYSKHKMSSSVNVESKPRSNKNCGEVGQTTSDTKDILDVGAYLSNDGSFVSAEEISSDHKIDGQPNYFYRQITPIKVHNQDLKSKVWWADKMFSEIELGAETGYLPAYFAPRVNVLTKIILNGSMKDKTYPSLTYLKKHCSMLRALLNIQ